MNIRKLFRVLTQKEPKIDDFMRKQPSKNQKNENARASFTRAELAKMHRTDARAIDRRCQALGIEELPRTSKTEAVAYMLTDGQIKRLGEPLPRGAAMYGLGSSDLRREKLAQEFEFLRLKNRKLRSESTPNTTTAEFLEVARKEVPDLIWRHLERYADAGGNREPAELRQLGKDTNDGIRSEIDEFLQRWLPAFEGE